MGWKIILSVLFFFLAIGLLLIYWFIPISDTQFISFNQRDNSVIEPIDQSKLQFYSNMRFPYLRISYNIEDCPIKKTDDMERAFQIIEDLTILDFYPSNRIGEITVICDDRAMVEGGLFIAGEGGPSNITKVGDINLISKGKILLYKESECTNPNIATHELLHALGFDHVLNLNDLMYNVSKCSQTINQETINLINELYSTPSYPDLVLEEISASMHGKYLNTNFTIKNEGLIIAPGAIVEIYADEKKVREVYIDPLDVGHGKIITLTNLWINQFSTENLKYVIVANFDELKKENNKVELQIKKN